MKQTKSLLILLTIVGGLWFSSAILNSTTFAAAFNPHQHHTNTPVNNAPVNPTGSSNTNNPSGPPLNNPVNPPSPRPNRHNPWHNQSSDNATTPNGSADNNSPPPVASVASVVSSPPPSTTPPVTGLNHYRHHLSTDSSNGDVNAPISTPPVNNIPTPIQGQVSNGPNVSNDNGDNSNGRKTDSGRTNNLATYHSWASFHHNNWHKSWQSSDKNSECRQSGVFPGYNHGSWEQTSGGKGGGGGGSNPQTQNTQPDPQSGTGSETTTDLLSENSDKSQTKPQISYCHFSHFIASTTSSSNSPPPVDKTSSSSVKPVVPISNVASIVPKVSQLDKTSSYGGTVAVIGIVAAGVLILGEVIFNRFIKP